jgi:hypothetical protein
MEVGKTYAITMQQSVNQVMESCYVYELTETNTVKFATRLADGIVFVEMATSTLSAVETTPDEELEAAVKAAGYM